MSEPRQSWVEDAALLPVAFSQVREDALLDRAVVEDLGADVRLMMVASGGCTAALLASMPQVSCLHLVDPNPAQLALTKLKLRLLSEANAARRLALLGHLDMPAARRRRELEALFAELDLAADALGLLSLVSCLGPDHAGRYEQVFAALRSALAVNQPALDALLQLADLDEQSQAAAPDSPLGRRLDAALEEVMPLPNLVCLFGRDAVGRPLEPFSRHFARRIRHVLAHLPAADNPYLWQMLKGCYPPGRFAPWFGCALPGHPPEVVFINAQMESALKETAAASCDFIHLSNILDWLSPEAVARTLELAGRVLKPAGRIFIRQLNSALDIRRTGTMFEWLGKESAALLERDRSFFYRALHLGRKK